MSQAGIFILEACLLSIHHQFGWVMQFRVVADRMIFMATEPPKTPVPSPVRKPDRDEGGSVVLERRTQKTQPPQMYQVVMLNDDYTPMEFVVVVIQEFFGKDLEAATQIMLKIHLDGKGVCGVYSKDVAATKVDQVLDAAHKAGHPLKCISEPVEF
jgi:ATP-dependent Clp protease adaptor protein ClpS